MKGHLRVMDMLFILLIVVMVHRCVHVKTYQTVQLEISAVCCISIIFQ